jgi:hypothetical protein
MGFIEPTNRPVTTEGTPTMNRKLTSTIAAFAIAGGLGIGVLAASGSASAAGGDPVGGGQKGAKVCANIGTIDQMFGLQIDQINSRITYLQKMKDLATQAGRTKLVTRLDTAITKSQDRLAKVQAKQAKVDGWASTHCASPSSTTVTTAA